MIFELLNDAINELQYLNQGDIFLLKDLFKGYIWERIDKSIRRKLGSLFLEHINSNPNLRVIPLGKTSSNQQKYQKI